MDHRSVPSRFQPVRTGIFGRTVEDARGSEEREQLLEEERNFVGYCAVEFRLALRAQCSPGWEEPSKSVSEARSELVSELQIAGAPPGRRVPVEATKRDVPPA